MQVRNSIKLWKNKKMLETLVIKKKKYYKLSAHLLGKLLSSYLINPLKPKFPFRWQCWWRTSPPHSATALCCPCLLCQRLAAVSAVIPQAGLENQSGLKEPLCSPRRFFIWITATRPCGLMAAEVGPCEGQQRQERKRSSQLPSCDWGGFAILYLPVSLPPLSCY